VVAPPVQMNKDLSATARTLLFSFALSTKPTPPHVRESLCLAILLKRRGRATTSDMAFFLVRKCGLSYLAGVAVLLPTLSYSCWDCGPVLTGGKYSWALL